MKRAKKKFICFVRGDFEYCLEDIRFYREKPSSVIDKWWEDNYCKVEVTIRELPTTKRRV
jgi:hypothetical protein